MIMKTSVDINDIEAVKRWLVVVGKGRHYPCIVRDLRLDQGDFVQLDNSPENSYELTGGVPVVVPYSKPGLYGVVTSWPAWYRLPTGAVDAQNNLIADKLPDWKTCLRERYYRTASFEIAGDGDPHADCKR
jgi:hypothetical protein